MQVELQLFRLFYNERNIAEAREKIDIRQKEHDKVDKKKDKLEDNVRDVKKNAGKKTRDLDRVTQDIRDKEAEISKKKPAYIKAKEKTAHMQKKAEGAKKSLSQAEKAEDSHKADVQVGIGQWTSLVSLYCMLIGSVAEPEPVLFGRSRSRCKDVKAKTCFLLLFSLFLYEKEPELEPVKKKYPEPVQKGPAPQHCS